MKLEQYKHYLDLKTAEAMRQPDDTQSRYQSFKLCLDYLVTIQNSEVLELGTCRSFVDGAYEGCNSNDPKYWDPNDISKWDWGAGCFSLVFGQTPCNLTTLDLIGEHINRCRIMTNSLGIKCNHVISDSLQFLSKTTKKYHLIYVDTGDMWPIEPTAQLQLEEAKLICSRDLVQSGGLLLIDDVKNKTPYEYGDVDNKLGKSKYSMDYFINHGFNLVFEGYQYILQRT